MKEKYDVIIIGGGPAGLTAALYLSRASISTMMISKNIGGKMSMSPLIENYPGFSAGPGSALAIEMLDQIYDKYDSFDYVIDEVIKVDYVDQLYIVTTADGDQYVSKYLIAATGSVPNELPIENNSNVKIHYCPTCDGRLYENQEVAVIGDANSALQYSLELIKYCSKVHLCAIGDKLYGEKVLIDRVKDNSGIIIHYNFDTDCFRDNTMFSSSGESINVAAAFVAIGNKLQSDIFEPLGVVTTEGYIRTNPYSCRVQDNFYAVGDIRQKLFYQITTAVSDGTYAALDIIRKN